MLYSSVEKIVSVWTDIAPNLNNELLSLRSGGVYVAANPYADKRCIQRNGRWKCVSSKSMYIKDYTVQSII